LVLLLRHLSSEGLVLDAQLAVLDEGLARFARAVALNPPQHVAEDLNLLSVCICTGRLRLCDHLVLHHVGVVIAAEEVPVRAKAPTVVLYDLKAAPVGGHSRRGWPCADFQI